MSARPALAICGAVCSLGLTCAGAAQDAAETAVILSGAGQSQGGAARSLGSTISRSMGAAANAVRGARPNPGYVASRRRAGNVRQAPAIPADVDMLEGTDAPTYRLGNGASIRVSGRLIEAPRTSCVKQCAEARVP